MKREYSVVYQEVEDRWIMATVPELPGAVTQGRDMDEARDMIKELVELLLESYREIIPIPPDPTGATGRPRPRKAPTCPEGCAKGHIALGAPASSRLVWALAHV